ncbi:MAG: GtrA family protein, partial [Bacteroidales bacterium]|nr:GtrA family protein [Bacteroidales bacterium]
MIKKILQIPVNLLWKIDNKFIRFLFVGVLNTVVGYLLYVFFIWIGLRRTAALLVSYILGVLWNYKTTGYMVFENSSNKLIFKFFAVYAVMYVINALELHYLASYSGLYDFLIDIDEKYLGIVDRFELSPRKVGDAIGQAIVILPNAIVTFL